MLPVGDGPKEVEMTDFNNTSSSEPRPIENFEEDFSGEGGEVVELTMVNEGEGKRGGKFAEFRFSIFQ